MTDSVEDRRMSNDEDKLLTISPGGCHETVDVHSAQCVKFGENLLKRLKAFEGYLLFLSLLVSFYIFISIWLLF